MRLIIAEKPSVAKAVRAVLPSGTDMQVTHCFGHMLELAEPDAYNKAWAKWDVANLPIRVDHWKLLPKPEAIKQINVIKDLLGRASEVIHCGDPDREGQLLVDELLDHFGWKGPVKRLLITAADPASVKKALGKLEDNKAYQGMRQSAECRQRADWLVGMNLTRAVTKLLSPDILVSIGRVQTPTLALVVRRHQAIHGFASKAFYTFGARFTLDGGRSVELKCEPDPRIEVEAQAKAMASAVRGAKVPLVVQVTQHKRLSPLPYHLGDFQKAAERHYGWSISRALEALQEAYEGQLTSYPRVDCPYLPREQMGDAIRIAKQVVTALNVEGVPLEQLQPKPRVYDSSKVEVHHGIIPTGQLPSSDTSEDARKAWKLVSLHFLRTLLPDELYEQTAVYATIAPVPDPYDDLTFSTKREKVLNAAENWNTVDLDALLPPARAKKSSAISPPLPVLRDGELATLAECQPIAGKTEPPKPYTESLLREDMSSVAKYVTDPRVKAILKETSGIGTPATQADTIKRLIQRGYIQKKGVRLEPTELGIEIIRCIPTELADPGITAAWEDALSQIAAGKHDPLDFMKRVDVMVAKRLEQSKALRQAGTMIKAAKPEKGKSKSAPTRSKKGRPSAAGDGAQARRASSAASGGKSSPKTTDPFF